MSCTATTASALSELDFVLTLRERFHDDGRTTCTGPLITMAMTTERCLTVSAIFASPNATRLLWEGLTSADTEFAFALCAAHWLDLTALIWLRSRQHQRLDWHGEADRLLRDVCSAVGWDTKEILNMLRWQTTRLT